jgi:hypothetical protein
VYERCPTEGDLGQTDQLDVVMAQSVSVHLTDERLDLAAITPGLKAYRHPGRQGAPSVLAQLERVVACEFK